MHEKFMRRQRRPLLGEVLPTQEAVLVPPSSLRPPSVHHKHVSALLSQRAATLGSTEGLMEGARMGRLVHV